MRIDRVILAGEMARRDMKYSRLAVLSGLSTNTVYMIKSGKSCSDETARKIADALGVKLETIIEN